MKQNLYIPGDLIYFGGERAMVESYAIGTDDIYVRVLEKGGENRVWAASLKEEIDGIPLTPEILEKNGWKESRMNFTNIQIPRISLCTREEEGDKWSVSINGDIMGGYIYYVHQLQHILFAFKFNSDMEV